jgi:hypothetical protein
MTTDRYAVRWALTARDGEITYTRWHWASNENWTACGRMIAIGRDLAFLPETDEQPERVDCRLCRSRKSFKEATR